MVLSDQNNKWTSKFMGSHGDCFNVSTLISVTNLGKSLNGIVLRGALQFMDTLSTSE